MKILILDDDTGILAALRQMLIDNDHDVDCSDNAVEAVEMVKQKTYDFVLVDYRMPDNDGIWFMENANIPRETRTLLSTAYVNREIINRMFELGACGYLIKPYREEELLKHLDYHSKPRSV